MNVPFQSKCGCYVKQTDIWCVSLQVTKLLYVYHYLYIILLFHAFDRHLTSRYTLC